MYIAWLCTRDKLTSVELKHEVLMYIATFWSRDKLTSVELKHEVLKKIMESKKQTEKRIVSNWSSSFLFLYIYTILEQKTEYLYNFDLSVD